MTNEHEHPDPRDDPPSTEEIEPALDHERIRSRAELLTVEQRAGSDDPTTQARAILADSEQRMIDHEQSPGTTGERRTSDEATDPLPEELQR